MNVTTLLALALGVLSWTFLEYVFHRWLGHRWKKNFFGVEHTRHHSQGDYFAPGWKKGAAALAFVAILVGPAMWIGGVVDGAVFTLGLAGLYLTYEWLHRRDHTHAGFGFYGRWARRHHFYHHFVDPSKNHGVTTPIWDLVFGTYKTPTKIVVPEKLKMRWLTQENGDVWPEFADRYAIRRRKTPKAQASPDASLS